MRRGSLLVMALIFLIAGIILIWPIAAWLLKVIGGISIAIGAVLATIALADMFRGKH